MEDCGGSSVAMARPASLQHYVSCCLLLMDFSFGSLVHSRCFEHLNNFQSSLWKEEGQRYPQGAETSLYLLKTRLRGILDKISS